MRKSKTIFLLLCGIVFGLAAFPVFAQETDKEVKAPINKRAFQDLGDLLKYKLERGEIDFDKSFKVVLEGFLTPVGKFDLKKSKFTLAEGDEAMVNFAKNAIEAIGDSGYLIYLRNMDAEKVKLTVAQDGETFSAIIESEHKDESQANMMASALNLMFNGLRMNAEKRVEKFGEEEMIIINGFQKPKSEGKNFILNFALPKQTFKELILRSLPKTNNNQTGE